MDKEQIANNLLWPMYQGIAPSYRQRYARSIWQQFEDNIRSAAYTSKLAAFYDKLTQRLGINLKSVDLELVQSVAGCGEDTAVLKLLRDETTYLVLLVRLRHDEAKEEYKARKEANQEELF